MEIGFEGGRGIGHEGERESGHEGGWAEAEAPRPGSRTIHAIDPDWSAESVLGQEPVPDPVDPGK